MKKYISHKNVIYLSREYIIFIIIIRSHTQGSTSLLEDYVLINILQHSFQRDKYIYIYIFFSSKEFRKNSTFFSSRPVFHVDHDEFLSPSFSSPIYAGYARLKRSEFNAMQLFRVARDVRCGSASQSNFETIQNAEVTRVGVTCSAHSRRHRQILLDLVVSPYYSLRTCLQLCRRYALCNRLRM